MLFRYTENSPENAIFAPAALRVSAMAFSYTENSSFPYRLPEQTSAFHAEADIYRPASELMDWFPEIAPAMI